MTPAQFRKLGEALYGPRWQSNVAEDIGVADRTVRRWLAGYSPIPPGVRDCLLRVAGARMAAIREATTGNQQS